MERAKLLLRLREGGAQRRDHAHPGFFAVVNDDVGEIVTLWFESGPTDRKEVRLIAAVQRPLRISGESPGPLANESLNAIGVPVMKMRSRSTATIGQCAPVTVQRNRPPAYSKVGFEHIASWRCEWEAGQPRPRIRRWIKAGARFEGQPACIGFEQPST